MIDKEWQACTIECPDNEVKMQIGEAIHAQLAGRRDYVYNDVILNIDEQCTVKMWAKEGPSLPVLMLPIPAPQSVNLTCGAFTFKPVLTKSTTCMPIVVEPIGDTQWLDGVSETSAAFMEEVDALVDREAFVHNLGALLSQTREGITKCELVDECVVVTFKGGATRTVNVRLNSYAAIIRDVLHNI